MWYKSNIANQTYRLLEETRTTQVCSHPPQQTSRYARPPKMSITRRDENYASLFSPTSPNLPTCPITKNTDYQEVNPWYMLTGDLSPTVSCAFSCKFCITKFTKPGINWHEKNYMQHSQPYFCTCTVCTYVRVCNNVFHQLVETTLSWLRKSALLWQTDGDRDKEREREREMRTNFCQIPLTTASVKCTYVPPVICLSDKIWG